MYVCTCTYAYEYVYITHSAMGSGAVDANTTHISTHAHPYTFISTHTARQAKWCAAFTAQTQTYKGNSNNPNPDRKGDIYI